MTKENIRTWLAALRSGDYEQGHSCLHDFHGRFCCLGVACDVSGLGEWKNKGTSAMLYEVWGDDYGAAYLPTVVQKWLGVDVGDFKVTAGDGTRATVSWFNDNGYTFEQIADAIEEELLCNDS